MSVTIYHVDFATGEIMVEYNGKILSRDEALAMMEMRQRETIRRKRAIKEKGGEE